MAAEQGDQSGIAVFDVTSYRSEAFDNMDGGDIIEGKVDWKGRATTKQNHGGLFTSTLLLVALGCNQMTVFAIMVNLVSYLSGVMHLDKAESTNALTNFLGTSSIIAFFLVYLADSYIGRCRTLSIGTCVVLSGFILMTFQALVPSLKPAPCNIYDETTKCEKVEGGNAALLYVAMYIVALGLSGIRSSGPVHGADQFDQNDPKEALQMSSFFNWLLLAECVGGSISLSLIVWVQTNIGWDWGFGISTIASLMCAIVFFCGMPRYRMQLVQKTDALFEIEICVSHKIMRSCMRMTESRKHLRNYNSYLTKTDSGLIHFFPNYQNMWKDHTKLKFCWFLDKAAIQTSDSPNPWGHCRVTQVENAKMFSSIFPVFCCTILMSAGQAQMTSFSIHQGLTMDACIIGDFKVPPGSLPLIPVISLIFIIPMYERFFIPFAQKITGVPTGITYLQRTGGGLFLTTVAMAAAGFVEVRRKELAKGLGMLDAVPEVQSLPMSILWLAFQQVLYSVSEMFTNTGLQEFFYAEAPKALRSVSTTFVQLSMGIGFFLSTAVVTLVNQVTKDIEGVGWLEGNNLNRSHLERFYWFVSLLGATNFLIFLFFALRYKYVSASYVNHTHTSIPMTRRKDF